MKNFALIFLITIAFIGCKSVESQQAVNSNPSSEANTAQAEVIPTVKNSLEDLTEEQKQKLDQRIPPEVREILDKADEISIYYDIDEKTMKLEVFMFKTAPNARAKVSDPSLKKELLESFYQDAASIYGANACFSPRHRIAAKYKIKTVEMDICYECSNFRGESSAGSFGGALASPGKSSAVIDAIIKKYGKKIK
ncbi:MAG TPA: hypothetical protein VK400_12725 [Pyrinomonadaceae bacterium]|nr:hypothetical protein [Pyrinomonadaceae bacterium]